MLKAVAHFFEQLVAPSPAPQPPDEDLAIAALLIEVATSDGKFEEGEHAALRHLLEKQFHCPTAEILALIEQATASHRDSVCLYAYTSVVKQASADVRERVIYGLWKIAFADGRLDPYEEASIRKVAELLYVSHSDFVRTKLQAQAEWANVLSTTNATETP